MLYNSVENIQKDTERKHSQNVHYTTDHFYDYKRDKQLSFLMTLSSDPALHSSKQSWLPVLYLFEHWYCSVAQALTHGYQI